jgi:PAS domain S-box-containing protein
MNSWLPVALVAGSVCFSIFVLVYCFLYSKYKERFLLLWALAWLSHMLRNAVILFGVVHGPYPGQPVAEQWLVVCTASLLLWGTLVYSGNPPGRRLFLAALTVAAWPPVASALQVDPPVFYIPAYFFFGAAQVLGGWVILRGAPAATVGGRIAGWALILWGLHHLDYPFLRPVAWFAPWGFLIGASLGLLSAIAIIMAYFERVQEELAESDNRFRSLFHNHEAPFLLVEPQSGAIVDANDAAVNFYGYSRGELQGMGVGQINTLPPEEVAARRAEALCRTATRFLFPHRLKSGELRTVEVYSTPVPVSGRTLLFSIVHDVTARVEAERAMAASLAEKEVLLREIHHRVKNNLQIVSSLLYMQEEYAPNPASAAPLMESRNRIWSMAQIHERLYNSNDFNNIDIEEYLRQFLPRLVCSYEIHCRVELVIESRGVSLPLEQAVPFGLLVNELVTNALKHAFAGKGEGVLNVQASEHGERIRLTVRDNGVGWPGTVDLDSAQTLGLQLVGALSKQLEGQTSLASNPGAEFNLDFPRLRRSSIFKTA